MNSIVDGISLLSATATGSLCSAIWEGAVLALCVSLCLHFLPRLSAAARSTVWLNLFVLLALLHFLPAITEGHHTAAAPHASWVQLNLGWSLGVAGLWISLSLWRGAQLVASGIHQIGSLRGITPPPLRMPPGFSSISVGVLG